MTNPSHPPAAPTPEEVGAMWDRYGELLAMALGESAVHIGMFTSLDEPRPVTTLLGLADRAQERQTEFLIDQLALTPGDHLLDIGCGTGGPALRLAERTGARVSGINVSAVQLERCEERLKNSGLADRVSFAHGDAMRLAHPDESFDAAWSIDCFPHLSDRPAGLRETRRVLRPGGQFLLTEFALRGDPAQEALHAFTGLWTSPPPTRLATLLDQIAEAGLRVTRLLDMSPNMALLGELLQVLYRDRHDEIERRYGAGTTAFTDPLVERFRAFSRDHLDYYLLLLTKPGTR
ncbi:methyltransferase domain-containing protein [Streptomyces sp. NPDC093252]|uniref:SAM-dependent methyltransferase n=1 Tax=Streptomyces sp. NPDC093252 TaxID=3154980 RepID=UPI0034483A50